MSTRSDKKIRSNKLYIRGCSIIATFKSDSLFKNSFYLMLSMGVMAALGFVFWFINTKIYSPDEVGIGTTLISAMALISSLANLGLGNSIIKFLPKSKKKNELINTAFTIISLASVVLTFIFLIFIKYFSPELLFVRNSPLYSLIFIFLIVIYSCNFILDYVFISYRSSIHVLTKNTLYSIVKILLPIILVAFGAYGIFMTWGLSLMVACVMSVFILIKKFKYRPFFILDKEIIINATRFSIGNYIAGLVGTLPSLVLPLIITSTIGARFSGFFYLDLTIANLLYVIPFAVSQSLFAEGSHDEEDIKKSINRTIKIITAFLLPSIVLLIFLGKYILLIYGNEYSEEGFVLLQILAVSGIFVSINTVGETLLKLQHEIKTLIFVNALGTLFTLGLSYGLIYLNLLGIGIAWTVGSLVTSILYLLIFAKRRYTNVIKR